MTRVLLTFIIKSYIFYFRCMESWNGVMAKVEKVKSGSETFLEACTYFIIINNSGSLFALWWSEESQTQHNTTKQCGAFKVKTLLREVKVKTRLSRVKGVPPHSTIYNIHTTQQLRTHHRSWLGHSTPTFQLSALPF